MASKLFLRNTRANGITDTGDGLVYDLITTAGAAIDTGVMDTVGSGTNVQFTKTQGGSSIAWISGRVPSGGFTLTSVDVSAWLEESNTGANARGRFRIYKYTPGTPTITELGGSPFDDDKIELSTSPTEDTWTANVTDTAFAENDRVLIRFFITNNGTMGSGRTCTISFNAADAATGDSFVTLAETVAFKAEARDKAVTFSQAQTQTVRRATGARRLVSQGKTALCFAAVGSRQLFTQAQSASGSAEAHILSSQTGTKFTQIISAVANFVSGGGGGSTTQKALTFTQAQAVTLRRAVSTAILAALSNAASLVKSTGYRVTATQANSASGAAEAHILSSQAGTRFTQVITAVETFVAAGGATTQKALTFAQVQSVTVRRAVGKIVSAVQAQAVTLRRAAGYAVRATQAQAITVLRLTGRRIALSQGQTASGSRSFAVSRINSVTQAQAVTLRRTLGRVVSFAQAQSLIVRRAMATAIRVTQAQVATVLRSAAHRITLAQANAASGIALATIHLTQTGTALSQTISATATRSTSAIQKALTVATSIVASGVALATIRLTQTGAGLGQVITTTRLLILGVHYYAVSVVQSYLLAITLEVHDILTMPQADVNQSVTVRKSVAHRIIASAVAILVTVRRPVRHIIAVFQAQAITFVRGLGSFNKAVNIAIAQSISFLRAVSRRVVLTLGQTVRLFKAAPKVMAVVTGQTVRLFKTGQKLVAVSVAQTITLLRSVRRIVALSVANSVNVIRAISRRVTVSGIAQSATVLRAAVLQRAIAVTQAMAVVVRRSTGKVIASAHGQLVSLRASIEKIIRAVQSQSLSFSTGSTVAINKAIVFAQAQSVSLLRAVSSRLIVLQARAVTLLRSIERTIAVVQARIVSVTAIMAALRQIVVQQAQSAFVASSVAGAAIISTIGQAVTLFRPVSKQVFVFGAGQLVSLVRSAGTVVSTALTLVAAVTAGARVTVAQIVSMAQAQSIALTRVTSKIIAAQLGYVLSTGRGISRSVVVGTSQAVSVFFGNRVVEAIISVVQTQFVRVLRRFFVPTDPERILRVSADDRMLSVAADERTIRADPEDRSIEVPSDTRDIAA